MVTNPRSPLNQPFPTLGDGRESSKCISNTNSRSQERDRSDWQSATVETKPRLLTI